MEFALLVPVVLLVLLALVQVGVLARDRLLLAQAARAGAREAAIVEAEGEIRSAALAAAPELDDDRLSLAVARAGARGDPVTVSLSYDVPIAGFVAGWLLPDRVTLTTSATARQEFG